MGSTFRFYWSKSHPTFLALCGCLIVGSFVSAAFVGCAKSPDPEQTVFRDAAQEDSEVWGASVDYTLTTTDNEIKVMSYNVENLFDAEHDLNHGDWTYLPKSYPMKMENCAKERSPYYRTECEGTDWTEAKVAAKIGQIAKVIAEQGESPDILGVQEIENEAVARRLADRLGMEHVLITTGSDGRGINNALLYKSQKLQLLGWESVVVAAKRKTRDILVANFRVGGPEGEVLTVAVNHWPSQGNDPEERIIAAKTLKAQFELQRQKFGARHHTLAIGDFNTIAKDEPHPFRDVISATDWTARLLAVNDLFHRHKGVDESIRDGMPMGSYFYDVDWQTLDYLFVDSGLTDGVGLDVMVESFRILASRAGSGIASLDIKHPTSKGFKKSFRVPATFEVAPDGVTVSGSSDHFPVVVKFKF